MRRRGQPGDVGPELAAELLARGQSVTLRARGSSMAPLIRDGDVLTLEPPARPPRVGDLVAARRNERLLVHRVVRVELRVAWLQGDALWQPDGSFAYQILGHKLIGASTPEAGTLDASAAEIAAADPGAARIVGRVVAAQRGARALGAWRLGGLLARLWLAFLPLVRGWRGVARRSSAPG